MKFLISNLWLLYLSALVLAGIIAMLCFAVVITAGLIGFANADYAPAGTAGIASAVLGVLSVILCCVSFPNDPKRIILTACYLCAILAVNYITGFLVALIMGFQRA